jgi:hemoglobin-like flavoprotein
MDIQQSLARILKRREPLADLFYLLFLDEYPEVRQFFLRVNMKRQAILLTMALQASVEYYSHSFPAIAAYLKILGEKHKEWGIPRELYPKWRAAMMSTLGRFHGDDWTPELAGQWDAALDLASQKMLEGYGVTAPRQSASC